MTARRLVPLTGVAAIALFVISAIGGGESPAADAPAAEAVSFYTDNETSIIVSAIIAGVGSVSFLFFASVLRGAVRQTERGAGVLSAACFAGGLMIVVGLSVFIGITITLVDVADELGPAPVRALNALNSDMFATIVIGMVTFLLATGLAILTTGLLPKWLGWVAIVFVVAAFTPAGFVTFLGTVVWVGIISVLLSLREGRPATTA